MITPKGFVLLGSMRAGACERGRTQKQTNLQGLLLMVPCRVLHRAVVFRGVVSLSSVDYVYVLAGAQGEHKVGHSGKFGKGRQQIINKQRINKQ